MPNLIHVDPNHLDAIWPYVVLELSRAVDTNKGEESLEQIRLKVRTGHYQLLIHMDDDVIQTVVVAEFINFPNLRVAHVAYAAKSLTPEGVDAFKQWAKMHGASELQTFCGDAQARLFQRFGFAHTYHVMRVSL